jgi:hypothetical protein
MRIEIVLLPAILLLANVSCSSLCRVPQGPPSAAAEQKSSLQLISGALKSGEIDEDEATLYRVYSVFDESKLPPEYRGKAPIKDGTPVLRDARSRFDSLRPETQDVLRPYLFPRGQ